MQSPIPKFIGAAVKRREDPQLLTGRAKYVADVELPGALWMYLVRSPQPHAQIQGVDRTGAQRVPRVVDVLVAAEINPSVAEPLPVLVGSPVGEFESVYKTARFPLQENRVRFVGDPVAVVVAEDPYAAADGAEAVHVDYEPLEVVSGVSEAAKRPAIHDECSDNRAFVWRVEGGDVDRAFREAAVTVELEAAIQRLIPNAMEPRAVAAAYDSGSDHVTLWTTTQIPHQVRDDLAAILNIPAQQLRVIAPEVGGGFGAKSNVYPEEVLAVLLARKLKRPVRWNGTRSEDYVATSHGRDQRNKIRLAADAEGRVTAADLTVEADVGAYLTRVTPAVTPFTGVMMTGVYDIPAARARAIGYFTNRAPIEPYRGAGRPEACYMIERAMDLLARKSGLDPAEIRRRNFIPSDRFPYRTALGLEYDSGDYGRALDRALQASDYSGFRQSQTRGKSKLLRGIGLSSYVEICGFGPWESGTVSVAADGSVTVLSGTTPNGQGHQTSWAQITAETLQLPMDRITVKLGDTGVVPRGIGTFGSRSAPVGGTAVLESSVEVRRQAKAVAAHLLEADIEDLVLEEGRFHVIGAPHRFLGWDDVARAAHSEQMPPQLRGGLTAEKRYKPRGDTYPFGVHVCVVEVDPETGSVKILRYLTVDDCGRVINPLLVEGQVQGGIAQGLGQALWEEAVYDDFANLLTGTLMDYGLPRADSLPLFETARTETPTPLNALGVKGIGEAATIGSTPAVVNAVMDALRSFGIEHLDTPLTAPKIWRALKSKRS